MSKSNTFETDLLTLIFNNTDITTIGDAGGLRGSAVAGSLYISLHTADPTDVATQATSEATYTGYARVALVRTNADWLISGNTASNINTITFAICTAGSNTITHFGVGVSSSGANKLLYSGAITTPLAVSNGITPSFAATVLTVQED